uniref:Retrovirus-related Pol polyprotein from transposon TNT 1-94-like beta-barrel domain-containing protein n=1 Tax=Fagus sylvatica TaxID=28930 RepID=A0A2N9GJJ1_FAGSY
MILLSNISNLVSVKLDQSNYVLWKYQITSILKAYSVLGFVDGTHQCPPSFFENGEGTHQENPLYQQWISRDQGLLTLINSTLSPTALSLVVGQTTAHGVWSILEKRYTSASRSNILNLKMELHNIKKESTDSVNTYLQKIKEVRDRLGAVGVQVDNEEILHIVLKGLPYEYHALCTAIRTRNDATSFEDVHVLLTAEEHSLKNSIDLSKDHSHMALLANVNRNNTLFTQSGNRGRGRNGFNRDRGRNFHNNNSGRGSFNNSGNSGGNSGNSGGFNGHSSGSFGSTQNQSYNQRPSCQICGKTSHVALDCYHRMDYAYQGKQPPSKLAAMAATSNAQHSDQTYWLSDTGATDHFTPDLSVIPDHQDYIGGDLATVGNGQVAPITHIGNSQLKASSHLFNLRKILRVPSMSSNLLSVNKFCRDNNFCFHFDANQFKIKDLPTGNLLYRGPSKNGLYPLNGVTLPVKPHPHAHFSSVQSTKSVSAQIWHDRLRSSSYSSSTASITTCKFSFE